MEESSVTSTKTETIGDPPLPPVTTSQNEMIDYTTNVLNTLKDGDQVTFVYHQGSLNKTNRIDLAKGITKSTTETENTTTTTLYSVGWKSWTILSLIVIPWSIGMYYCITDLKGTRGQLKGLFTST
jgi:hypothetical protein